MQITTAAVVAIATSALATQAQIASIDVATATAAGNLGETGNAVLNGTFTESFTARSLQWQGTLNSAPNFFFFEEDVFASIQGQNGLGYTGPVAGEQGIFLGATPFSGWASGFAPASVAGDWSFEAYTKGTAAGATNWTIEDADFTFDAALFPDANPITTGTNLSTSLTEGQILWYSLDHLGGGLEISTQGSEIFELEGNIQVDDTLIALFDASGDLVEANDDGPFGDFTSFLSFADLAAGDYHLAVTGSTLGTRVGENFIATSHDGEGTIQLSIAVPAPGTAAILAFAGIAARRRR